MMILSNWLTSLVILTGTVKAFELFGSHVAYETGHELPLKASGIFTMNGPNYPFFEGNFFCEPKSGLNFGEDYLGELLAGSRLVNTPITIKMKEDRKCVQLCDETDDVSDESKPGLNIEGGQPIKLSQYPRAEIFVDSLPVISKVAYHSLPFQLRSIISEVEPEFFVHGVALYDAFGLIKNHWNIEILIEPTTTYHIEGGFLGIGGESKQVPKYTVVGAVIRPQSAADADECLKGADARPFDGGTKAAPQWFYSVTFTEVDDINYATRWGKTIAAIKHGVVTMEGKSAFASQEVEEGSRWIEVILDTSLLALLLVLVVFSVVARMLKQDFESEADAVLGESLVNMSAWKLLKADVFRKPPHSTILCAVVGGGLQVMFALIPMALALLTGIVPQQYKGRLIQIGIVAWAIAGMPAGYLVCRLYRMFESPNWKMTVARTALIVPGASLAWALTINFATWCLSQLSQSPVPQVLDTWAILRLTGFWLFVSLPMVAIGCFFGLRAEAIVPPVKPSKIPRPSTADGGFSLTYLIVILTCGSLIHASSMALVDAVFKAIFQDHNSDGVVAVSVTFLIWCVLTGLASVCTTFYLINDDTWQWWWYSFIAPASCGVWIAILLLIEAKYRVQTLLEAIVYLGITGVVSSLFAIMAGTIGFLSSLVFMLFIYKQIRLD